MNINDLKPASQLAKKFGVKALVYGPPGTGKTPLCKTAPRPVILATEPGLLSMRDATNIPVFEANSPAKIKEFFDWVTGSKEVSNFDTVCVDSFTQLAEIILNEELPKHKNKMQAYGELGRLGKMYADMLYYMPNKHVYMIAKEEVSDENGVTMKRPSFPGQQLKTYIPHLFDEVFRMAKTRITGVVDEVVAMQTKETYGVTARDRSGDLNEFEQPNLADIFNKCTK